MNGKVRVLPPRSPAPPSAEWTVENGYKGGVVCGTTVWRVDVPNADDIPGINADIAGFYCTRLPHSGEEVHACWHRTRLLPDNPVSAIIVWGGE